MQVSYELTQNDFIESFTAHRNRNVFSKWVRRLIISIVIVVLALVVFVLAVEHNLESLRNTGPMFLLVLGWAGVIWGLPRWSARRQFLKQPGAQGARSVELDESGAHWRWNGGSSDIEWKNYVRWLEGKNQFLFYTSPACFNIVPKRALEPMQLDQMRELLKLNIRAAK